MSNILEHIMEIKECAKKARHELQKSDLSKVKSELKAIICLDIEELKIIQRNHGDPRLIADCMEVFKDAKKALNDLKSIQTYEHAKQLFLEIERIEVLEYRILNVKLTSTELIIPIEFRSGVNPRDPIVVKYIRLLKKVPNHLRAIITQRGGYIVFFNGPLTDNREWVDRKGVRPRGWSGYTWDNIPAGHNPNSRGVFFGIRGEYVKIGDSSLAQGDPCLHELGHSFNDRIGEHLFGRPLSQVPVVLQAIRKEPFSNAYLNEPSEYIANSFDMFYRGKRTRNKLKRNHSIIYNFMLDIEQRTS